MSRNIYDIEDKMGQSVWVLVECPHCGEETYGLSGTIIYEGGRCWKCAKDRVKPYEVVEVGPPRDTNPPEEWFERTRGGT